MNHRRQVAMRDERKCRSLAWLYSRCRAGLRLGVGRAVLRKRPTVTDCAISDLAEMLDRPGND